MKQVIRFALLTLTVNLLGNCATYTYVDYFTEQRFRSKPHAYDIKILAEEDPGHANEKLFFIRIHIEHSKSPWVQEDRYQRSIEHMQRLARQLGGDAIVEFRRAVEIVPILFQGSDWGGVYTPVNSLFFNRSGYSWNGSYRSGYSWNGYYGPGSNSRHATVVDPSVTSSFQRTVISGIVIRYTDENPYR